MSKFMVAMLALLLAGCLDLSPKNRVTNEEFMAVFHDCLARANQSLESTVSDCEHVATWWEIRENAERLRRGE